MKRKYIFLIVVLLVIIVIIGSLDLKPKSNSKKITVPSHPAALPKEVTIILDKNGFSPKEITISVGSAVRWVNKSGDKETVNSDDYPTNQLHRELNFGVFSNGSSVVYTFKQPGTYGYHNQFHYEQIGKVIVTN